MSPPIGGSTPAELIPGNPGSLEETAREFAASGTALGRAAEGLARIDTSAGWSGQAAEAFRKVFDNQPGKWKTAADAFAEASGALMKYASELEWAQGQAAAAIRTWNSGDHDSAQRTLTNARSALSSAADTASRAIGHARDLAPPKPGWLSELGHDIEDVASDVWHGAVNLSEDVVDALASYGNAIVHDLGADLETAFGIWLIGAGLTGEFIGTALDVTVVLSPGGAAINLASAVPIALGGGLATAGLIQLSKDASGPDQVHMQSSGTGGSGSGDIMEPQLDDTSEAYVRSKHFRGGSQVDDTKGIFDDDADLDEIVEQSQGSPPDGPNKSGFYERTVNTGKVVGVTSKMSGSKPTTQVTVVQDKYGSIITMYPS